MEDVLAPVFRGLSPQLLCPMYLGIMIIGESSPHDRQKAKRKKKKNRDQAQPLKSHTLITYILAKKHYELRATLVTKWARRGYLRFNPESLTSS